MRAIGYAAVWLSLTACSVPTYEFASSPDRPAQGSEGNVANNRCANGGVCVDDVRVYADANGDGVVSPGEDVTIEVSLFNSQSTPAMNVYAALSKIPSAAIVADCIGVSGTCPSACACTADRVLGTFAAQTSVKALRFGLRTERETVVSPMSFEVVVGDTGGARWKDSFDLEVIDSSANIAFGEVRVKQDNNGDSKLSPGDEVQLALYPRNTGRANARGVSASLVNVPSGVVLTSCMGVGAPCNAQCMCERSSTGIVVAAGSVAASPALTFAAQLGANLPIQPLSFQIRFEDETRRAWNDVFSLELVPTEARVEVAQPTVANDTVRNGRLDRGEQASILLYATNVGKSTVRSLVARLRDPPAAFAISSCTGTRGACGNDCGCAAGAGGLNLGIGAKSTSPVLNIVGTLSETAPSPLTFTVEFEDDIGNIWPGKFDLEVP